MTRGREKKGILGGNGTLLRGNVFLNGSDFGRLKARAAANSVTISQQIRIDIQEANRVNVPNSETELQHYANRLERRLRSISNTAARAINK